MPSTDGLSRLGLVYTIISQRLVITSWPEMHDALILLWLADIFPFGPGKIIVSAEKMDGAWYILNSLPEPKFGLGNSGWVPSRKLDATEQPQLARQLHDGLALLESAWSSPWPDDASAQRVWRNAVTATYLLRRNFIRPLAEVELIFDDPQPLIKLVVETMLTKSPALNRTTTDSSDLVQQVKTAVDQLIIGIVRLHNPRKT